MAVVDVQDVSLRYFIGNYKNIGLKEYLIRRIKKQYIVREFTAIEHITFSLEKGDMLGIIGTNGSGKSTLLKTVAGIMPPSTGYINVEGRVAALLELTTGFDQSMTVRENIYLRGALLGYQKNFINEKYDEIIDFAELENFQDFTFEQLSTGMRSRLAFSIACLVSPDILILDEVLSVGDAAFKEKSQKKMSEIMRGGATTIMVSHDSRDISDFCNKVLWIDKGKQMAFSEDVAGICNEYKKTLSLIKNDL